MDVQGQGGDNVKERIKAIRGKQTQLEFAKSLNVSLGSVQGWEYGLGKPSFAMRRLICTTYGINQTWLETGEGEMYVKSASQTLDAITARYNGSPTFRAMLDVYARLSADDQRAVERYIAQLAEALAAGQNPEQVAPSTWRTTMEESEQHNREHRQDSAQAE